MDEKMASQDLAGGGEVNEVFDRRWFLLALAFLFANAIYVGCVVSPPSRVDGVDAGRAQVAKTLLTSGDWITARLDGFLFSTEWIESCILKRKHESSISEQNRQVDLRPQILANC
jgi:hypothetical protein